AVPVCSGAIGRLCQNARHFLAEPLRRGSVASNRIIGMPSYLVELDPRELRVPSSREGADPIKLARQIARFGASDVGMPSIVAYEGTDGHFLIYNRVTRATRIARLAPGRLVRVEVKASPSVWS